MKPSWLVVLGLVLPVLLLSQEFRGTITGNVTDATGSAIPGTKVTVTEVNTGTHVDASTDANGTYTAQQLLPGDYEVRAISTGFKEFVRKGIHVGASDRLVVDISLAVGDASQSMEVTGDVPLVNIENASVGQAITTKEVEDLPLNGGTPITLASLAIGVLDTAQPSQVQPFSSGGGASFSIGGSAAQTNEILVNGSPDTTWDGRLAYSPPRDAVQEVHINAFDTDAGYGHTGGGVLNQIIKSGTNSIHGTLSEFNQPNTLTANNFFNNKNNLGNPVTHFNQYGATVGGPIVIPRVFNGKDKLFFFFAWEAVKQSSPNTTFLTVPTAAERNGDFSALLNIPNGSQYQLYNPYTAVLNGSTITRSPYANNIIPANQISPIAQALLKYIPLPNVTPQRPDGFNNYGNTSPVTDDFSNFFGRVDYNMSQRNRMFMDVRTTDYQQVKNDYFQNLTTASLLTRTNWGSTLDDVFTVNANNVLNVRLNFTRLDEAHPSPTAGFDPTTLGFPSSLLSTSQLAQLPYVTFATNSGFQSLGTNGANKLPSQSLQLYTTWTTIKGSHTLKAGADIRQYRLNVTSYGNSVGNFAFTANNYVRQASNSSSTVVLGQDFAEFLLGLPTGGSYDINTASSFHQNYAAGFVQDDWRIRRNLTVNLGLRFDHDSPYYEKYGRSVNGFDPTAANPLATAATAAYTRNASPLLPASAFNVRGGLTFAEPTNTAIYNTTSHLFSPRAGLAWSPDRLHGRTSIRAGFGMFVQPITIANFSLNGNYSTNPILTQEGFSQSTTLTASNNNYQTPTATLANPFPNGVLSPVGSANGLGTYAGQTITFLNPNMSNPYSLRWNLDIQQQLGRNTMLEVAYIGNHGVHIPIAVTQINGLPRQYLSTLPYRDQATITALTATVPNPFLGLNTNAGTATTVATNQLLAPYPQFPVGLSGGTSSGSTGVLVANSPAGSSYFESVNVRLQHRFSNGLTLISNYIHSKLIERTSYLNDSDPTPEKRISSYDRPNKFITAISYELPFGANRRYNLHYRAANAVLGDWGVNGIYRYQSGRPLVFVNGSTTTPGDYVYLGGPLNLNPRQTNTTAFDTSRFDTLAADQFQYHIRTFSTTFPDLREDGINQFDASVLKRITFNERTYFQLRGEVFNLLNHPTFGPPNLQATNSSFGLITTQSNRSRSVQVGARFVF